MTESLKMTTLSMKMLDFEGSKGPKIVQNWYPAGFKSNNFQKINCKAAAEGILETIWGPFGRPWAYLNPVRAECAKPLSVSFRRLIRLIRLNTQRLTRRSPARGAPYSIDCPRGAPPPPHFFCHLDGYKFYGGPSGL